MGILIVQEEKRQVEPNKTVCLASFSLSTVKIRYNKSIAQFNAYTAWKKSYFDVVCSFSPYKKQLPGNLKGQLWLHGMGAKFGLTWREVDINIQGTLALSLLLRAWEED